MNQKSLRESGKSGLKTMAVCAAAAGALLAVPSVKAGSIFYILMENHNLTQPPTVTSPLPIQGNVAAPYMNSLMTPGNPNAAQVSVARAYYNAGLNDHPSEPNYVWWEAGSNFGFLSDSDPSAANKNVFYDTNGLFHVTGQLNSIGVTWNNYQEDIQFTTPTNSASGTSTSFVNPYYGNGQFNYAPKHNPAAFFFDSVLHNLFPIAQLGTDLQNNTVAQFNIVTPNQFDDAHSGLSGGFTYKGTHYTGDQAAIAQGDNFLSIVVPQIMASPAYQNNGAIVIWWDETEGGDTTSFPLPIWVISPLAKGNAYNSTVPMSHSSDIKTIEEIFGLPWINNVPTTGQVAAVPTATGYNNVPLVNDMSDLYVPGTIPQYTTAVTKSGLILDRLTGQFAQSVTVKNTGTVPVPGPLYLVLDGLSADATLAGAAGKTKILPPLGSSYVTVPLGGLNNIPVGGSATVNLNFNDPTRGGISYTTRVLPLTTAP